MHIIKGVPLGYFGRLELSVDGLGHFSVGIIVKHGQEFQDNSNLEHKAISFVYFSQ